MPKRVGLAAFVAHPLPLFTFLRFAVCKFCLSQNAMNPVVRQADTLAFELLFHFYFTSRQVLKMAYNRFFQVLGRWNRRPPAFLQKGRATFFQVTVIDFAYPAGCDFGDLCDMPNAE